VSKLQSATWNVPVRQKGRHSWHCFVAESLKVPGGQWQAVRSELIIHTSQGVHAVAPGEDEMVPGGHSVHASDIAASP
jgi:hypothetical protein